MRKPYFKNPYELIISLCKANVKYGKYDIKNKILRLPDSEELWNDNEYWCRQTILKPYEVWKYKAGTCFDLSLLLWYQINKMEYTRPYVWFIESFEGNQHAAVYAKTRYGWIWVEYSWYIYRGIHGPYSSKKELFDNIMLYIKLDEYYKDKIRVTNTNVNFLPLLKLDIITINDFMNCCYENANYYELDTQPSESLEDNKTGQQSYYRIYFPNFNKK